MEKHDNAKQAELERQLAEAHTAIELVRASARRARKMARALLNEEFFVIWRTDFENAPRDEPFLVKLRTPDGVLFWDQAWYDEIASALTGTWRLVDDGTIEASEPIAWMLPPEASEDVVAYQAERLAERKEIPVLLARDEETDARPPGEIATVTRGENEGENSAGGGQTA